MTSRNRQLLYMIKKARDYVNESAKLLNIVMMELTEEELSINLHASNSDNLEETIQCFVQYGEDEDKIDEYFRARGD